MVNFTLNVLLTALLSAFIVNLYKKVGFIEWLQINGSELISKMAHCDFCLSWWTNVVISIITAILSGDWMLLFMPLFGTMISRFLL